MWYVSLFRPRLDTRVDSKSQLYDTARALETYAPQNITEFHYHININICPHVSSLKHAAWRSGTSCMRILSYADIWSQNVKDVEAEPNTRLQYAINYVKAFMARSIAAIMRLLNLGCKASLSLFWKCIAFLYDLVTNLDPYFCLQQFDLQCWSYFHRMICESRR